MNWEPFPFDPTQLGAVVLTHAHLDHSGALPLLVKRGYRGPVIATPSTIDMCRILLPDSGRLQEEDAEYINRHKLSKHLPALPLYTEEDAERTLRRLEPLPFEQAADVAGTFQARLLPAGHILGASSVELTAAQITVLFSVDLGPTIDGHASYGQLFPAAGNGPYRFRILVKPPNRATDIEFAISAWSPHRETR